MRYIVTATEFEFHERVYIVDAVDEREALSLVRRDAASPLIDALTRRKIIDPVAEPLTEHPSYVIVRDAAWAGNRNTPAVPARNGHEAESRKGERS